MTLYMRLLISFFEIEYGKLGKRKSTSSINSFLAGTCDMIRLACRERGSVRIPDEHLTSALTDGLAFKKAETLYSCRKRNSVIWGVANISLLSLSLGGGGLWRTEVGSYRSSNRLWKGWSKRDLFIYSANLGIFIIQLITSVWIILTNVQVTSFHLWIFAKA